MRVGRGPQTPWKLKRTEWKHRGGSRKEFRLDFRLVFPWMLLEFLLQQRKQQWPNSVALASLLTHTSSVSPNTGGRQISPNFYWVLHHRSVLLHSLSGRRCRTVSQCVGINTQHVVGKGKRRTLRKSSVSLTVSIRLGRRKRFHLASTDRT